MRKKLILVKQLVVLFLFSSACQAQSSFEKMGFGTNLDEGNLIIYIPIQFKDFIIEPTVKWSSDERTESSYGGGIDKYDQFTYEVGVGVFIQK